MELIYKNILTGVGIFVAVTMAVYTFVGIWVFGTRDVWKAIRPKYKNPKKVKKITRAVKKVRGATWAVHKWW